MQRIFDYHFREYFILSLQNGSATIGEGCSLSFDIPPDFEGLVIGAVCSGSGYQEFKAIIKNKSNGIQLFEATHARPYFRSRWLRVISRREMAMEKYCGDAGLELHVILRSENSEVVQCGIHAIDPIGRSIYAQSPALDHDIDNQQSQVESDRTIPPPYHLLRHPRHGSMRFSTRQQWKAFLIRAFSLWKIITMQKFSPDDLN
jgi:hypothetical protein